MREVCEITRSQVVVSGLQAGSRLVPARPIARAGKAFRRIDLCHATKEEVTSATTATSEEGKGHIRRGRRAVISPEGRTRGSYTFSLASRVPFAAA